MELGDIYSDAFGRHPFSARSFCGTAEWVSVTRDHFPEPDAPSVVQDVEMLLASVPESLHRKVGAGATTHASMLFLPWGTTGGVGIVNLVAGDDVLVALMDIAGRTDLEHLIAADIARAVELTVCSKDEMDMCPSVRLAGAAAAVTEAETRRRMSAKEFQEAIADVRWLLRTSAVFPFLAAERKEFSSITLNVVQPLKGRSGSMLD